MKISCYISFDEHFLWLYCAPRLLITSAPTSKIEFFASTFCSPLSTSPSPPPPPPPYATSSGNRISGTKDLYAITTQNPDTRLIHSSHLIWQRRYVWCFLVHNCTIFLCSLDVRNIVQGGGPYMRFFFYTGLWRLYLTKMSAVFCKKQLSRV